MSKATTHLSWKWLLVVASEPWRWNLLYETNGLASNIMPLKTNMSPWKSMVGRCIPYLYWNSPFLGDMLVFDSFRGCIEYYIIWLFFVIHCFIRFICCVGGISKVIQILNIAAEKTRSQIPLWFDAFGWCSFCNGSYDSKFHINLVSVGGLGECPRRSKPPGPKNRAPDIDMVAEVAPSIWKLVQGLPGSSLTSNHGTPTTSYNSASYILQATSMRQHVEHVRIPFSVTWGLHRIAVWRSNSRAP